MRIDYLCPWVQDWTYEKLQMMHSGGSLETVKENQEIFPNRGGFQFFFWGGGGKFLIVSWTLS